MARKKTGGIVPELTGQIYVLALPSPAFINRKNNKMLNQTVGLSYGVLSDPLNKQLDKQGFKYNKKKIAQFEAEREAINRLRFGSGLLTDSMVDKMLPKLHKKIIAHVAKENSKQVVNLPTGETEGNE